MSQILNSTSKFLRYFIQGEKYLQNPPLSTKEFIKFCKKMGVDTNEHELEFFEKEKLFFPIIRISRPVGIEKRIKFKKGEEELWRPIIYGLKEGEVAIKEYEVKYYDSCSFDEHSRDLLNDWEKEGNLYDPSLKPFENWENFKGEELECEKEKTISFYSSFQVYWIDILKKGLSIRIGIFDERQNRDFSEFFKDKKQELLKKKEEFEKILKFLLLIQNVYFPYARSGGGTIQIIGNDKKWQEHRQNFNLKKELKYLGIKIEIISGWYKTFAERAMKILGVQRDDWLQLWKNISWDKKDKLEGTVRLGIEYLQGALMLKRILGEHQKKEILDVDEITNISEEDILKFDPPKMDQYGILLRASRNKQYSDNEKSYYSDKYKRLFYLANDFGFEYQPRIMVFVEGRTEEIVFPYVFEWYTGRKPENSGVEFVSINGIDNFMGTEFDLKDQFNKKPINKLLSNFLALISYNLDKWQIIPFFIGDSENNISTLLKKGGSIRFDGVVYPLPQKWQFLWGIDGENQLFKGNYFELANFSNSEIAEVLTGVLDKKINEATVQKLRAKSHGLKTIGVKDSKPEIGERLIKKILNRRDKSVLKRPIFEVIGKISRLAALNHPPTDRRVELTNIERIKKELAEGISE